MATLDSSIARKAKRVDVSIASRLVRSGAEPLDVELCDLSFYGFKARASEMPAAGELVKVDLPHFGLVRAKISWARGSFFGGTFATAVDVRKCIVPTPAADPLTASRR